MRALIAIGIVLALCAVASADPVTVLHPGSRCYPVGADNESLPSVDLTVPSLIVSQADARESHADHVLLGRCIQSLAHCRARKKPEPRWVVALREAQESRERATARRSISANVAQLRRN